MQTLLNNAELQSLQSQDQPAFSFNAKCRCPACNDGKADRTSCFLENLAAVFRYNVRRLDKEVTLYDEMNSVRAYIDLMRVRFGDMISFSVDIKDNELMQIHMPPLILQPIVENACIHGIGEREEGGCIDIRVFRNEKDGFIEIIDNGIGMDKEVIDGIFSKACGGCDAREAKERAIPQE